MITIEDVGSYLAVKKKIREVSEIVMQAHEMGRYTLEGEGIEGDRVDIDCSYTHCSSCGPDYSCLWFPVSYLWSDNVEDLAREQYRAEKEDIARREADEEQDRRSALQIKKEQRDLQEYERLKRKYEEGR